MRDSLNQKCQLFVKNRDIVKSTFAWESTYMQALSATLWTSKNLVADPIKMKEAEKVLKKQTGVFSHFKGYSKIIVITKLALVNDPEDYLSQIMELYDQLRKELKASEYLVMGAFNIVEFSEPSQYSRIIERAKTIYDNMKKAHPFLTSSEDSTLAVILALFDLEENQLNQEMEKCYQELKSKPWHVSANSIQSLSHILTLGEDSVSVKCQKIVDIYEYLKSKGYKYGGSYELPTLAGVALLQEDIKVLAEEIISVDNWLKEQKGFGGLTFGKQERLMYATILTIEDYTPSEAIEVIGINSSIALVAAEQSVICALAAINASTL